MSAPLADLRVSLAGAGRVGSSMVHWARARGARVHRVASRSRERAAALAAEVGGQVVDLAYLATADDDLLLLAVADPALGEVATALADRPQAAVALHTSGLLGEEAIQPLARGCAIGACHPLLAFPSALPDVAVAEGAVFAIAGAPAAERLARRLATAFGGRPVAVPSASRPLYHAAATLAAGGVVTVLAAAAELAARAGLPPAVGEGYARLARGALARGMEAPRPIDAVTGPAARGDVAALARHLEALEKEVPEVLPLAVELALATLRLLAGVGPLRPEQEAARRLLEAARTG